MLEVAELPDGGLRLGALVTNSDVAYPRLSPQGTRCYPGRFWPGPVLSCATRPQQAETCCNAHDACFSTTRLCPATSASPARDAQRRRASIVLWPSCAARARSRGEQLYLATFVHVEGSSYRNPELACWSPPGENGQERSAAGAWKARCTGKLLGLRAKVEESNDTVLLSEDDNAGVPYGLDAENDLEI